MALSKLKKAIRVLNRTFNSLKLEKHPDKTVIGRIERGFGFCSNPRMDRLLEAPAFASQMEWWNVGF
jgi:hypothetical protein